MKHVGSPIKKFFSEHIQGFSLEWDPVFLRNLVIVLGVILVRRGSWNILDTYILPSQPLLSNILSIALGVGILYLPDGSLEELGGLRGHHSRLPTKKIKKKHTKK